MLHSKLQNLTGILKPSWDDLMKTESLVSHINLTSV